MARADIGIEAVGVWIGVVAVVLADPPAKGKPTARLTGWQPGPPVGPMRPDDLPMPRVMADELGLGEHHRRVRHCEQTAITSLPTARTRSSSGESAPH
jgi:hypothetical protein